MGARPSPYYADYIVPQESYAEPSSGIPVGTFLHKGFYDLLAMIPTPSPSRLIWGTPPPPSDPDIAGLRYEDINTNSTRATARKGRRISKDMVSKPAGFVYVFVVNYVPSSCVARCHYYCGLSTFRHLVHASDVEQLEVLLTRWGPDGQGKLGGQGSPVSCSRLLFTCPVDPRWANPIKTRIRQNNQARAVNEVVNALNPSRGLDESPHGQLRVINGISTTTSSTLTTAARENVAITPFNMDGLPGRPANSTIRWGGLTSHPEVQEIDLAEINNYPELTSSPRIIIPSLATLDKAVSARIYFENLYFPLLRHTPSREQRRLAMEKDMMEMQLSQPQKEHLRGRWRQNETDYLRERRRKVDVSAFVKLKTIGHGLFPHSLNLVRH
jgi:protein-serine/threonine kinase